MIIAVLVLGAGASWAATGRDPFDLFIQKMIDRGASDSFIHSARQYEADAPPGTQPGPVIGPDEVHVPAGSVPENFVSSCWRVVHRGEKAIERDPLCRAVLLKDEGQIAAGVYKVEYVEEKFKEWIARRSSPGDG